MRQRAPRHVLPFASSLAIAALACATWSANAVAGPRYSPPGVQIFLNGNGGYAEGTLGGTRNSANTVERITCTVTREEILSASGALQERATLVVCTARNAAGRTASCASESEAIANGLNGLSNDGLLRFSFDANAQCTDILVYESSSLEVKK
jgi:hypothetical protein